MLRSLLGFLLAAFFAAAVAKHGQPCANEGPRNSFLWKIKRDPPAYFFGTIHVPYTRVWNHIPSFSKRAFRSSDNVFFELDLTNAETRASLTRCQMLPGGTDLREVLPADLYRRLKSHLDYVRRAMPGWLTSEQEGQGWYADALFDAIAGNWERKRPVWVMLMVNSLTEADIRTQGIPVLDLHLAHQAGKLGKRVGAVEEVDEQCKPLNGLNMSQVLYALNYTLLMQERMRYGTVAAPYTTDDLIQQYNCGDLNSSIFDSDSSQFPKMVNDTEQGDAAEDDEGKRTANNVDYYFRNELIYRRNQRMAQRVKILLEKYPDESFFFAFGAGHFLGNGSVIDFLRKDGFEIEHSEAVEALSDAEEALGAVSTGAHQSPKDRKGSAHKRQAKGSGLTSRRAAKALRRRNRIRRRKSERNNRRKGERKNGRESSYGSARSQLAAATAGRYDKPSYEVRDGVYQHDLSSQQQIRVVNRYPTASPALHDVWRIGDGAQLHQHLNSRARTSGWQNMPNNKYRETWDRLNAPASSDTHSFSIKELAARYERMMRSQNGGKSLKSSLSLMVAGCLASLVVSWAFGGSH